MYGTPACSRICVLLRRYKEGPPNLFHHSSNISYYERLSILNLPSLQYNHLRMDLIMTYKILHSTVNLSKNHLNTNPSRTNGLKVYKHSNTDYYHEPQ